MKVIKRRFWAVIFQVPFLMMGCSFIVNHVRQGEYGWEFGLSVVFCVVFCLMLIKRYFFPYIVAGSGRIEIVYDFSRRVVLVEDVVDLERSESVLRMARLVLKDGGKILVDDFALREEDVKWLQKFIDSKYARLSPESA